MKWFLILCFLLPLNLFAEQYEERVGNWVELINIDDFTDEMWITVTTIDRDEEDVSFAVRWFDGNVVDYAFRIKSDKNCTKYHEGSTNVLFRVDKNELFEMRMIKQSGEKSDIYMVDFKNWITANSDGETTVKYLTYINELIEGKVLRIRVNDSNNNCKKDLTFELKEFDKAIKNLSNEISHLTNTAEIQEFLNNSN